MINISATVKGHGLIKDNKTGEILLDKYNAIHNKNLAIALARGLAAQVPDATTGLRTNQIFKIKLGNGGSSVDTLGVITFNPPNVVSPTATLYNETYSEIIDDSSANAPAENSVTWMEDPSPNSTSTIIVCSAIISADEPSGQLLTDTDPANSVNNQFAFDEMGLFTSDDLLLSHLIFAPLLKTANRELALTYTLTITVN